MSLSDAWLGEGDAAAGEAQEEVSSLALLDSCGANGNVSGTQHCAYAETTSGRLVELKSGLGGSGRPDWLPTRVLMADTHKAMRRGGDLHILGDRYLGMLGADGAELRAFDVQNSGKLIGRWPLPLQKRWTGMCSAASIQEPHLPQLFRFPLPWSLLPVAQVKPFKAQHAESLRLVNQTFEMPSTSATSISSTPTAPANHTLKEKQVSAADSLASSLLAAPKQARKELRARSSAAAKSQRREKRRRKQQQQVVNKNRKAGEGMFWDGFQWVPRADTGITNDINASRKNRRLYLGNLPYHLGVTEDSFSKQLYETMRDRSMCNDPNQNPRALQLDGMLVLGVPVSIKRPNDAVSPLGMIGGVPVGMQMPGQGGMLALPSAQVSATSPIIRIDEILKVDEKTTEDCGVLQRCGAHGKLVMVAIVKPEHAKGNATLKPGDVYLQCATTDEATKVMRAMGHRKYDGRRISMTSYEESKFNTEIKPLF
eukprot:g13231.t1